MKQASTGSRQRIGLFVPLILMVLLAGVAQPLHAEGNGEELICWSPDVLLTWQAFRAEIPSNREPMECCAIETDIRWTCSYEMRRAPDKNSYVLRILRDSLVVADCMDPEQSWYDPSQTGELTLQYMQMVFDIVHVYAERLWYEFLKLEEVVASVEDAESVVQSLASRVLIASTTAVSECETETAFGRQSDEVHRWRVIVDEWLASPARAPLFKRPSEP